MSSNTSIRQAVGFAVGAAAAGTVGYISPAVAADATTAGPPTDAGADTLSEVVVTGTRVRRVDAETADPVFVLDQSAITESGAVTVGDLISRIPSIAGAATNPSVNNGGGFGESNIELRGLDAQRTLILIDGRRVDLVGASGAVDVNQIPLNLIDHVDVLKEGAAVIYGSDAIAGVVNFVTRKGVDGLEVSGDWGESSKHDAKHHNFGAIYGTTTDKFNVEVGFNYNQQDELTMAQRNWSKYALYLYSGTFSKAGSSRVPTGRVFLTSAAATTAGCSSLTRIAGTSGSTVADYRCFTDADKFNYQPYNLNVTPQERAALFSKVNYKINDYVEFYGNTIYNHTHSASQIAPLPFDANSDQIVISKDSIYNPFGTDFGGGAAVGGVNPNYTLRLTSLGDRYSDNYTDSVILNTGLRGEIWNTGWNYDANVAFNREVQVQNTSGYLLFSALQNAVGPSYIDPATGTPTCGTPAAPISGCTPVDIFNLGAASQVAALNSIAAHYDNQNTFVVKSAALDVNGTIVPLPAGNLLASAGIGYTGLSDDFYTSTLTQALPPLYLNCQISQEACTSDEVGSYHYRSGYLELFAPLVKDLPGVTALNVDLGYRYSDYSLSGSTNRSQFKVEYRPIRDVLVRGTLAQVFRAPTINDLFSPPSSNSPTFNDVCAGYTGKPTAQYPNLPAACVGVPTNGGFAEPNGQIQGEVTGNLALKPETGLVKTLGVVYDTSFIRGLSVSADYWHYTVNNLITTLQPNYAAQQCAITGAAEFCDLLHRYASGPNAGQFIYFEQPTFNLGELVTDGIDYSIKYALKTDLIGTFQFSVDETHLMSFKSLPAPGSATLQVAGTYNSQFGFYAKDRATFTTGWSGWDANALLTIRYIGGVSIPFTNLSTDAEGNTYFAGYHLGSVLYYDLTAGYTVKATNTSIRAGILNLADKTPPIAGINSFAVGSTVTDITTYDAIGRRFFVGLTQKF